MRELSLHILDIVQNSISADASLIQINILEDIKVDIFKFSIEDNGKGMDLEMLKTVSDPFSTTRTTRRVGLGIPLLKMAAEQCDGEVDISSVQGRGTQITAWFVYSHIDRAPLGDIAGTMVSLIVCNPSIDFVYYHKVEDKEFKCDTREIKQVLNGVDIGNVEVVSWLTEYFREGITSIYGGVI